MRLHGIVGHGGPGSSGARNQYFFEWLTDPVKNGAGALMDFGCYNALWSLWYLGRPESVFAQVNQLRPQTFPKVEDTSSMMSWISVVGQHGIELPKLVPHAAGYRVIGDASAGKQKAKVYLDVLLLGRDRTLTMVVLTSYTKPLPGAFEEKIVRTISDRLLAG